MIVRVVALLLTTWVAIVCAVAGNTPGILGQTLSSPPGWVLPGATFDLDYARQRYWYQGRVASINQITATTRSTVATCISLGGTVQTVAGGVPCINDRGLSLWPASTNLLLQSAINTTNANWAGTRATLTGAAVTSPDDTTSAATLIEDATATSTHFAAQTVVKAASALPYNFTVWAKSSTRTRIALQLDDAAGNGAVMVCDLAGQQVGVNTAGVGVAFTALGQGVEAFANGWTRCRMTATSNTAVALVASVMLDSGSGTGALSNSYSGNGTSGGIIWGAQLEQRASYPSGYIPTTTASVTRNLEFDAVATTPALTTMFGTNGVSMFAQFTPMSAATPIANQYIIAASDSSLNNAYAIYRSLSGASLLGVLNTAATVTTSADTAAVLTNNVLHKVGYTSSVGTNTLVTATDGVIGTAASPAAIPSGALINRISIGSSGTSGSTFEGYIERVAVWPNTIMTSGQLKNLTSN